MREKTKRRKCEYCGRRSSKVSQSFWVEITSAVKSTTHPDAVTFETKSPAWCDRCRGTMEQLYSWARKVEVS